MGVKTFLVFIYAVLFCVTDYETFSIVGVRSPFFSLSLSEQEIVKLHSFSAFLFFLFQNSPFGYNPWGGYIHPPAHKSVPQRDPGHPE